jgi:hypothetical protein
MDVSWAVLRTADERAGGEGHRLAVGSGDRCGGEDHRSPEADDLAAHLEVGVRLGGQRLGGPKVDADGGFAGREEGVEGEAHGGVEDHAEDASLDSSSRVAGQFCRAPRARRPSLPGRGEVRSELRDEGHASVPEMTLHVAPGRGASGGVHDEAGAGVEAATAMERAHR